MTASPDLSRFSTEELAQALAARPTKELRALMDADGFVPPALWPLRRDLGALPCVDSVPMRWVRKSDGGIIPEIMFTVRGTDIYAGRLCNTGGTVPFGKSIEEAVRLHYRDNLGREITFVNPWTHPFAHQGFWPDANGVLPKDFHPDTKHSVALFYVVKLHGDSFAEETFTFGTTARGREAKGVVWFDEERIPPPNKFGYGQAALARQAFQEIRLWKFWLNIPAEGEVPWRPEPSELLQQLLTE